jgi:putative membrane protein
VPPAHTGTSLGAELDLLLALPFVVALLLYLTAVGVSGPRRPWPLRRTALWCAGVALCLTATTGPLAERGDHDFRAHMVTHLLLGMLGPLLLVLAAPLTLALRALPVRAARRLVRVLASPPARFVAHPVTAAVLDLGGLWVIYSTKLFSVVQADPVTHGLVHVHVLVSGYLFTAAVVGVDPNRHHRGYRYRAVVLVLFLAGHSVLAKHLYASPPVGVPTRAGELGALIMYYGGDLVDLCLVMVFCYQRYGAGAERGKGSVSRTPGRRSPGWLPRRWSDPAPRHPGVR